MKKSGIDYFSVPVTFSFNFKVLEVKFGLEIYSVYIKLLQEIFRAEGYYVVCDDDFLFVFANQLNIKYERLNEMIKAFIDRDIFDKTLFDTYGILTNDEIQVDYLHATKRRNYLNMELDYCMPNVKDSVIERYEQINNLSNINTIRQADIKLENNGKNEKNQSTQKQAKTAKMYTKSEKMYTENDRVEYSREDNSIKENSIVDDSIVDDRREDDSISTQDVFSSSEPDSSTSDMSSTQHQQCQQEKVSIEKLQKEGNTTQEISGITEQERVSNAKQESIVLNQQIVNVSEQDRVRFVKDKFYKETGKAVSGVVDIPQNFDVDAVIQKIKQSKFLSSSSFFTLEQCIKRYDKIITGAYDDFLSSKDECRSMPKQTQVLKHDYSEDELKSFYTNIDDINFD